MKGLLFIPDISGFTSFVRKTDINLGVSITKELLNEIIDSNPLGVEISEIEGDAILFYKIGKPISLEKIFSAFKTIFEAFQSKLSALEAKHSIQDKLRLKFILHYGDITIYHIKGFNKLYGQSVIESHRLLKNGSGESNYILITDDYIKALESYGLDVHLCHLYFNSYTSQEFTDLREISYYVFNYSPFDRKEMEPTVNNVKAIQAR